MHRILIIALAAAMTACAGGQSGKEYTLTVPVSAEDAGNMVYLTNYDTGVKLDSALVTDTVVVFTGEIAEPVATRLTIGNRRLSTFILEPGSMAYDPSIRDVQGGELNARAARMGEELMGIQAEFEKLPQDSTSAARAAELEGKYMDVLRNTYEQNSDNPIGLLAFMEIAMELPSEELEAEVAKHPNLAKSVRVNNLREMMKRKADTSAGKPFKDFAIEYEGKTTRLSDYVGKGKYVLVDFWASWCGPCIRESKTLKEIYKEYGPKGLEVLGVAVWDDPEDTKGAIEQHQLPWPQIINGGTVPTDIYGIPGIPCIILFDPEGNIVFRDLQGEALKAAVAQALEPKE